MECIADLITFYKISRQTSWNIAIAEIHIKKKNNFFYLLANTEISFLFCTNVLIKNFVSYSKRKHRTQKKKHNTYCLCAVFCSQHCWLVCLLVVGCLSIVCLADIPLSFSISVFVLVFPFFIIINIFKSSTNNIIRKNGETISWPKKKKWKKLCGIVL